MSLTLSNLKPAKGSQKKRKKIGRGGKRGTYSGRGMKGQRSRSGGKSGLKAMGMKKTLFRIPKNKGFKSLRPKNEVVNISDLECAFDDGDVVNTSKLLKKGLIQTRKNGLKILGNGELKKKFTVEANRFSATAKKAIIDAGGEVVVVETSKDILKKKLADQKESRKKERAKENTEEKVEEKPKKKTKEKTEKKSKEKVEKKK
jgi:large subunit ribosomal protein L15